MKCMKQLISILYTGLNERFVFVLLDYIYCLHRHGLNYEIFMDSIFILYSVNISFVLPPHNVAFSNYCNVIDFCSGLIMVTMILIGFKRFQRVDFVDIRLLLN